MKPLFLIFLTLLSSYSDTVVSVPQTELGMIPTALVEDAVTAAFERYPEVKKFRTKFIQDYCRAYLDYYKYGRREYLESIQPINTQHPLGYMEAVSDMKTQVVLKVSPKNFGYKLRVFTGRAKRSGENSTFWDAKTKECYNFTFHNLEIPMNEEITVKAWASPEQSDGKSLYRTWGRELIIVGVIPEG